VAVDLLVVAGVAGAASALTFFSGFGLGTILVPVFALFFPVPLAVAATAVVHFANNLFKLALLARHADRGVALRFGAPAALAALAGAALLAAVDRLPALARYTLGDRVCEVTPVKAVVGLAIVAFALLELWPRFRNLAFDRRWLPLGGLLSGFFGGLSGNQGALRAAFLLKAGLDKEAFVATGVVVAALVDVARLGVYGLGASAQPPAALAALVPPVAAGIAGAFAGAVVGRQLLRKITLKAVQFVVALGMLVIGSGLAAGWI
jgi:hypothetical protein